MKSQDFENKLILWFMGKRVEGFSEGTNFAIIPQASQDPQVSSMHQFVDLQTNNLKNIFQSNKKKKHIIFFTKFWSIFVQLHKYLSEIEVHKSK